jgi:VanZ family protein
VRAGFSWTVASVMCTILVLGLRMAQIYLPGRTAEITDATMLVMLAIIMKLMRDVPERY